MKIIYNDYNKRKEVKIMMTFKRTMLVTIPDYRYFKEILEWDIDSIEDLEERLSSFSEEEFQHLYNDDGFGNNIQYIEKIIK